jgi:hypothetical protein
MEGRLSAVQEYSNFDFQKKEKCYSGDAISF